MNYFILKSKFSLLAIMLFSIAFSYAQTVTVPSTCRVVVAGTGGTLGLGGKVGDGGMVSMPDPLGGGTFTFNQPSGVTTAGWNLKGDLSDASTTTTNGSPIQPAAGLQAKIITYNKYLRPNSTETSNPSYARSKGQVRVSWTTGTGCGFSMTFDVFKTFTTALPAIVGPTCLKPNTQYTYSVDRIVSDNTGDNIGFDSYYWTGIPSTILLSPGFYTSADNSSITFTTGSSVTPIPNLQCCYGRVNPNTADGGVSTVTTSVMGTHTTCVSQGLIVSPLEPVYSPAPPTCLPIGAANFAITYPNPISGLTYTWSAPNTGWTFSNNTTGTTTTTVSTNGNNNPGLLTLTITGTCDPVIFTYQINRSLAATTAIVPTSPSTTCIASSSSNTYTINASAVGVTLTWSTVPASVSGITLTPSGNTNSVTITATGATPGSFTLQAQGTAPCNTPVISTTINVQPAAPAFTAGTPNCVVRSATAITTVGVTPVSGATYDWTPLPAGVTCTANCNTANPSFVFNSATGVNSVVLTVKVTGSNGCNSLSTTKTINYISVATSLGSGGFPDQYLVNAACGTVTSWDITTASGTTNYTVSSGNIAISSIGGGTNNVLAISGSGGLPITGICANLAGGIQVCATSIGTYTQRQSGTTNSGIKLEGVTISPNPNSGNFIITLLDFKENASATLTDFSGNEIQTYQLRKGENKINKEELKKGTYFVILKIDGKQETRQIIIK